MGFSWLGCHPYTFFQVRQLRMEVVLFCRDAIGPWLELRVDSIGCGTYIYVHALYLMQIYGDAFLSWNPYDFIFYDGDLCHHESDAYDDAFCACEVIIPSLARSLHHPHHFVLLIHHLRISFSYPLVLVFLFWLILDLWFILRYEYRRDLGCDLRRLSCHHHTASYSFYDASLNESDVCLLRGRYFQDFGLGLGLDLDLLPLLIHASLSDVFYDDAIWCSYDACDDPCDDPNHLKPWYLMSGDYQSHLLLQLNLPMVSCYVDAKSSCWLIIYLDTQMGDHRCASFD